MLAIWAESQSGLLDIESTLLGSFVLYAIILIDKYVWIIE